jgi:hypothetical protein
MHTPLILQFAPICEKHCENQPTTSNNGIVEFESCGKHNCNKQPMFYLRCKSMLTTILTIVVNTKPNLYLVMLKSLPMVLVLRL